MQILYPSTLVALLQWGRGISAPEMGFIKVDGQQLIKLLQWGRGISAPEMSPRELYRKITHFKAFRER